jgi:hypothetical protein
VMTAKCKLSREECKDPNCEVHGEPRDESGPVTKGAEKLKEAEEEGRRIAAQGTKFPLVVSERGDGDCADKLSGLPEDVVQVLRDSYALIAHIAHQNDHTRDVVRRLDNILDPPKEFVTMDEARRRLGVAG